MGVDTVEEKQRSEDEDDWWESMMPKLPDPKKKKKKKRKTDLDEVWIEKDKLTEEEMKVLLEEVAKREEALFGDYKEDESPNSRWGLWLEVADKVNEVSIKHRSVEQVRIKWFEHKDPAHRLCTLNKRILYKRAKQQELKRRYWPLEIRPMPTVNSSLTSNLHGAKQAVQPLRSILKQASKTSDLQTISQAQNSCSTSHDDASDSLGVPLRSGQNKDVNDGTSEDIIIIDEIASKESNQEYEVIVIDDESTTNEGKEPNTSIKTVSRKEMSQSDDTKGSKVAATENLTGVNEDREYAKMQLRRAEEQRVKEWLELTDEERKARIKRILNNLKDNPQNNPRVITPRLKTVEKPRAQHFMISFSQNAATASLVPSVENLKNANSSSKIAENLSGVPSATPSDSSSNTNSSGSSNTNPSGNSDANSSESVNTNPSGSSTTIPSESGNTNPSESLNTNPSRSSNTIPSESGNTNPSGSSDANSSESGNTNHSGSSDASSSETGNTNPSGNIDVNSSESVNTNPSGNSDVNSSESGNTNPSGNSDANPSESVNTNPSGSSTTIPSESGNTNPSGSSTTIPSGNSNTIPSESVNTNPSGSSNTIPSESLNTNSSGSSTTIPSGNSNTIPSGSSNTIPSESVNTIPSESVNTNPSGSSNTIPSESLNTNSSGSSTTIPSGNSNTIPSEKGNINPSESSNTNSSGSGNTNPSGSNTTNPSESSMGKITEVFSMASAEEFQNLPSSNTIVSKNAILRLIPGKSVGKVMCQQPSSMAVVPLNQQIIPQIGPKVSPQVAIEQIFLEKEGETVKNTNNVKESFSRRNEDSHKKTSFTSMKAGPELFKEIFGVDATSSNSTSISELPVELFKPIQNRSTISNACMERSNTSGRSVTSVSKKANNSQKVNLKTVSDGSSHKNTMQSTSAGSSNDGLKQIVERPMKVYSGKSALRKRVMHSAPDLSGNKRKQIFQPSEVIDLTNEGSVDNCNLPNVEGNKTGNPKLIEIKDPVTGNSFLILQEKSQNVEIQEKKSMVNSPEGDKQSIPLNPAPKIKERNEANKLKQHMKKNFTEKLSSKTIVPQISPVCVIQGNAVQIPQLQKVQTPNIPILLRKNVSNPMPKPVTLLMLPSGVLASTSGIEKNSGVCLKPIQLSGNQVPVPVALHKSGNVSLKIIQQPVPVAIHKASGGPAPMAVDSQKNEEGAPVKDSSKIVVNTNGGRKKSRKDLGVIRPAALLTEDLAELKSAALRNQPVVVLNRLPEKMDEGHSVYRKGNEVKSSK